MTLHPSLGYDIITQQIEERARNAERARFVREHPEQIVRMSHQPWLRAVGRFFHPRHRTARPHPAPSVRA